MVSTRQSVKASNCEVVNMVDLSDEVKEYFDGLFQSQAALFKEENARLRATLVSRNKQLADAQASLQATTTELSTKIDTLQKTIDAKDERITKLEEGIVTVVQRNVKLESDIVTTRNDLNIRVDDLEQHGRKMCLRIEGIEISADFETNAELTDKVETALTSLGADVTSADFIRLHRSSRARTTADGRRVAQTIVRFRDWKSRSSAYDTRFAGTRKERLKKPYFVRQDLTKRRLDLLSRANTALKDHSTTHADLNDDCKLFVLNRTSKQKAFFNTERELMEALYNAGIMADDY